jgi:membrane-bound lytic murein transglycosylase B
MLQMMLDGKGLSRRILWLVLWLTTPMTACAEKDFQEWVTDFRATAAAQGISRATYDRAFRNVTAPDPEVIEKANFQPEFKAETWEYFDNRIHDRSIQTGRELAGQWRPWLDRIEAQYGVDRHVLLAIWSLESNYGEALKDDKVMRNAVRSLATLAYADPRRRKFARAQLIAALRILQRGDIDESHLTGSWAGAMGHTQFIPTSYQAYAVDMDGDGRRDIWNSVPDALASSANLLRKNGWQSGKDWGREVEPDAGGDLHRPDGRKGPAFSLNRNFQVIKRYNNADRYALAVGLLADRIAGGKGLKRDWNRPFTPLSFAEKEELQQLLKAKGFYAGEIDGRTGPQSRDAIRAFQAKLGLEQTGYPSRDVLERLRK